jgi:hypothetical protein
VHKKPLIVDLQARISHLCCGAAKRAAPRK